MIKQDKSYGHNFPLKYLRVHFGNSVLDNLNWHEISHSLTKKNQYFEQIATLFGMNKKKKNSKPNRPIQTLVYKSYISNPKIYQKGNWKNNSSPLHLEVWTRYFRQRYSIKLSITYMVLKIIKLYQCSLESSHTVLIELKE